ncbi:MAG: hypothetical protein AEth_00575 [Candidatus Argoarchaeum ethanivorans]|uniref:Uncharacterized protein n=1 Tax=Candidatus Argoarchaeum ethanivorans TaxID=2608793 RepID=A0A8B3S3Z1_9EURY|nr:MAG: hypothetical protein AEth_00575 [Candidatus Argoarchaeum ethanivorans]
MSERKLTIVVDINDDRVNSIEDLERETLAQDTCEQAARKYLDSLQDDMAQQVEIRRGSKKIHIKTPHFEFNFHAKRTLDEAGKKRS